MEIDCNIVGLELPPRTHEVTWRETTNYVAAIDDANPAYLDDTRDAGLIAHPVFPVALTWPVISGFGSEAGEFIPPEALGTMVHGREHLCWHRPLAPSDRLRITSRVIAVQPLPVGTAVHLELVARDRAGEPVFTETTGGLFRGVGCTPGAGAGLDALPAVPGVPSGATLWHAELPIARTAPYVYDGCTDIVFAIHTSPAFARMVGLPDILFQGTAMLALAIREIVNREADGDPRRIAELAVSFTGPVIPGTTATVELLGRQGADRAFRVVNAAGKTALRDGYVRLADVET